MDVETAQADTDRANLLTALTTFDIAPMDPHDKATSKRVRSTMRAIHDILWNDWDPIGVNGAGPDDEYDGYIPEVYRLLETGPSRGAVVDLLSSFESVEMGLPTADRSRLAGAAEKLLALDLGKSNT